jgi:hypothetical protein
MFLDEEQTNQNFVNLIVNITRNILLKNYSTVTTLTLSHNFLLGSSDSRSV